jgi:hypothetical protein
VIYCRRSCIRQNLIEVTNLRFVLPFEPSPLPRTSEKVKITRNMARENAAKKLCFSSSACFENDTIVILQADKDYSFKS